MRLLKALYLALLNNVVMNNIAIALGIDHRINYRTNDWRFFQYDRNKTVQENAGFSHRDEVVEAIQKIKDKLKETVVERVPDNGRILDIGCGPGLYVKELGDLPKPLQLCGTDISADMIAQAKTNNPDADFFHGHFVDTAIPGKFHLIYSISVIEYIRPSQLKRFYERVSQLLEPGGIAFIQYPHALSKRDTRYPDMTYIKYSPTVMQNAAKAYFRVVEHCHSWDGRTVGDFDPKAYPGENGSFLNGYLLIAEKR